MDITSQEICVHCGGAHEDFAACAPLRSVEACASGCECAECREWDHDEELGVLDLEDRLDAAFERSERQGELIEMFRREI